MKRRVPLLTVLAVTAAMIVAGCQEDPTSGMNDIDTPGTTAVGKKPTNSGGGGGKSNYISVTYDEGAVTANAFTAKVSSDSDSKLQANNDDANRVDIQLNLLNTHANEAARCYVDGDATLRDALVAQLVGTAATARTGFTVDKTSFGSPSGVNDFQVVYEDPNHPELGGIRLGIPAHGVPAPTVDEVLNDGTTRVYRFHSGVVRVWATRGGGPKDDVKLFCENPAPADGGDTILVSTDKI